MKRFLSVLLVLTLVCLCGCSKNSDDTSAVSEPESVGFAVTTVFENDTLAFRVLSETYDENGVTYNLEFANRSDVPLTITLDKVTLNDQTTTATVSAELAKDETKAATLTFSAEDLGSEKAAKVGVHLKATGKKDTKRWYVDTLCERDLVFYPIAPQPTATTI